jgi:NAD(P)-dependent dehydrogenase (short-subunit alcohol dehydrogenase family)
MISELAIRRSAVMDLALTDRVVIVTGGSSGIGLATLRQLLLEGACVATCARDGERLATALAPFEADRCFGVGIDVLDPQAVEKLVELTVDRFGRLDAVAALAGAGIHGHALELGPADWRREVTAKLDAVLNLVRSARRHLAASDAGRIVTVAAPTAREPDPEMAAVSAARAAVAVSLARSRLTSPPTGSL